MSLDLTNTYYTQFVSAGIPVPSGEVSGPRFFWFSPGSGEYEQVVAADGREFLSHGDAFFAMDRVLIAGRAVDESGFSAEGVELWELTSDGTVSLFQEIYPGPNGSYPEPVDLPGLFGDADTFLVNARYDSDDYEAVVLSKNDPVAPLANYLGIPFVGEPRSVREFDGRTAFIADTDFGDGNRWNGYAWIWDGTTNTLKVAYETVGPTDGFEAQNLYSADGTLYVQAETGLHGRELWVLNNQDKWELVDDLEPGFWSSSPSLAFSVNGTHYFYATAQGYGRKLHRLDPNVGLVRTSDFEDKAIIGSYSRRFEVDGSTYFGSSEEFFKLGPDGEIELVTTIVEGEPDVLPRFVVDFDAGRVNRFAASTDEDRVDFIVKDGELTKLDLPNGSLNFASNLNNQVQLFNGILFVNMRNEDGVTSSYAREESGAWRELLTLAGEPGDRPIGFSYLPNTPADTPGPKLPAAVSELELDFSAGTTNGTVIEETIVDLGGNDLIEGGSGDDVIVTLGGRNVLRGDLGDDLLVGGAGDDTLVGGLGNDIIAGERGIMLFGADRIEGGPGHDWLMGGRGADVFVFAPNGGDDRIAKFAIDFGTPSVSGGHQGDFEVGEDRIDLTSFGYSNAQEALSHFNDWHGDLRFADQGTSILIAGVNLIDLTESSLIF